MCFLATDRKQEEDLHLFQSACFNPAYILPSLSFNTQRLLPVWFVSIPLWRFANASGFADRLLAIRLAETLTLIMLVVVVGIFA